MPAVHFAHGYPSFVDLINSHFKINKPLLQIQDIFRLSSRIYQRILSRNFLASLSLTHYTGNVVSRLTMGRHCNCWSAAPLSVPIRCSAPRSNRRSQRGRLHKPIDAVWHMTRW